VRIDVVSASAGTGKTWRLTRDLAEALLGGTARPEGVVAVTYGVAAAGELETGIRKRLLDAGEPALAARVRDGYLGTIHAVCQRLLREFALEAGISPYLEPIPESERHRFFDVALAGVLRGREPELNELGRRLSAGEWKGLLREIVDKARENGMDAAALARSAARSRDGLAGLLGPASIGGPEYAKRLGAALAKVLPVLEKDAVADNAAARERAAMARAAAADMRRFGLPAWKDQVQLAAKLGLKKLASWRRPRRPRRRAPRCEAFHEDLFGLQAALADLAGKALADFAAEKAAARVVDYGDMLAQAHEVLSKGTVQEALRARLTSSWWTSFRTPPMQLAVVAALGALAKRSIWVGDRASSSASRAPTRPHVGGDGIGLEKRPRSSSRRRTGLVHRSGISSPRSSPRP
jgi:ATP-dependent exoDNAse (exonuclease V) beta subunit